METQLIKKTLQISHYLNTIFSNSLSAVTNVFLPEILDTTAAYIHMPEHP